jgi:HSP20 family molecular chaperone IbpA
MSALQTIKKGISDFVAEAKHRLAPRRAGAEKEEYLVEPCVDIYETPDAVSIFMDVPGVKSGGLRIEAFEDRLEITARRADRDAARAMSGFVPDGYRASYELNASLDPERIDAQLRDGVLRIVIPRSEKARPRRIEVK